MIIRRSIPVQCAVSSCPLSCDFIPTWVTELRGAVVPIVLGWWFLCSWFQKSTPVASLLNDIPLPTLKPIWQQKNAVLFKIRSCVHSRKVVLFCWFKDRYVWLCLSVRWCPIYRCPLNSGISLPAMFDTGGYHNDPMSMAKPHCWWRIHVYISQDIIICPWLNQPFSVFLGSNFSFLWLINDYKSSNPSFLAKMPQFSWSLGQSDTSFFRAMNPTILGRLASERRPRMKKAKMVSTWKRWCGEPGTNRIGIYMVGVHIYIYIIIYIYNYIYIVMCIYIYNYIYTIIYI